MYFNKLLLVPAFAYTIDSVAGLDVQLDFGCIQSKCQTEMYECLNESSSGKIDGINRSYCKTVATCMQQDLTDGLSDPASCLDGVDEKDMSQVEIKAKQCMEKNQCVKRNLAETTTTVKIEALRVKTMDTNCMSNQCSANLHTCFDDAVCRSLFECFELHKDGDASKCAIHIKKMDRIQSEAVMCGWSNKCFTGDFKLDKEVPTTALNKVPAAPAKIVDLANTKQVPSKASFLEVKPLSFLSIQTATEAELQAAEAQAEKQAKAAEAEWEQSRKNTDDLLVKVHTEIDALNDDLSKTSAQEKADLTLLEENRKKEDIELEEAENKLKKLASTTVVKPSSFLEGFNSDDFLAPLRKAAQQARSFAQQLKEHSFFRPDASKSSFLQNDASDRANKALSLAEQALKKLDADIAAQKKQLAEQEAKAKQEEQAAEAEAAAGVAQPVSFLQLSQMSLSDLKVEEEKAAKAAAEAKARWDSSKSKTDSLLAKVHAEIDHLNADLERDAVEDKRKIAFFEKQRKEEDSKLQATSAQLKNLESGEPSSFIETGSSNSGDFLAPLRKAAEDAKKFAEQLKAHPFGGSSSFIQTDAEDKAGKALSLAQQALKNLDNDIAEEKKELEEEKTEAQKEHLKIETLGGASGASSFLETGSKFDPLSPQALADWRDRFELQLQKAREAAGIHTPMHSSLAQMSLAPSFAENEQLKEDERLVERLENQYNQQMQKLKEDNAELLARAKDEMEKAKEEENRVKSQLSQVSFLETSHQYDPAKEEAHIRDLERKWIKEAETIVTPAQVSQQDTELQNLLEKQKVKEAESEAQLDQMKSKLNKDIEILNKDIAENTMQLTRSSPASFIQTGSKGPAETALERAEADLQKLKQQLREETAKLNAMHFDAPTF